MVVWKDEFSIGVDLIDEEHKHLFVIANEIYDLLNNDLIIDKYDQILYIINNLKDYTIKHFADEEAYMLNCGYRKFLSHKALHIDFIEKINAVDLEKIDNGQNQYLVEIMNFVCNWLIEHILTEDKMITA
ncbi:bacteriohemerythrin [Pelosinus sp. sgz500959]|uniref:bacteriohemerythrin n=1 Tax=Pelosinus sp. sgz500959 TaxID=3242472 RepID=UPI00366E3973